MTRVVQGRDAQSKTPPIIMVIYWQLESVVEYVKQMTVKYI